MRKFKLLESSESFSFGKLVRCRLDSKLTAGQNEKSQLIASKSSDLFIKEVIFFEVLGIKNKYPLLCISKYFL